VNARTVRPSSPVVDVHVTPPSRLAIAPAPPVPASTSPAVNGLKATVVKAALPECTEAQVIPPSALLKTEPSEFPAISAWLLDGSTARAKTADRPWCGSAFKATQVESGMTSAWTPVAAGKSNHRAASVATRRWPASDTSLPIITQASARAGGPGVAARACLPTIRPCRVTGVPET